MINTVKLRKYNYSLHLYQKIGLESDEVFIWWLGQAGFLFKYKHITCIIDPYLSDFLSIKYKGCEFPHKRMMLAPIKYNQLMGINYFFSTHAHSDHLDPEGLNIMVQNNLDCKFIIPVSSKEKASERGIPVNKMVMVNAGLKLELDESICVEVVSAAHEKMEKDADGNGLYLGYIISFGNIKLYHSGDCVPFNGQIELLKVRNIDLAFLPVNGRDSFKLDRGISGNFHYYEARDIILGAEITYMISHHFGMFKFNTINVDVLNRKILKDGLENRVFPAQLDICYIIQKE